MKTITLILMTVISLTAIADNSKSGNENVSTQYQVVSRVEQSPVSTALQQTKAESSDNSVNENITVVSERVLNKKSIMLKQATVQSVGREGLSAWQLLSDEGGNNYEQSSPNPLSYLTTGISSNLLTQLQRSAKVMGLEIEEMKVEVKVFFRWDNPFSPDWKGYTDKVIANVLINSKESPEKLSALKAMAMKGWVAGEGLANKTEILPELIINGQHWDSKFAFNGSVPDPVSVDNGFILSEKTTAPKPTTFETGDDVGMGVFKNPTEFAIVAIAESANDSVRPYLQKIRVRAVQENYAAWNLYADDSYKNSNDNKGVDRAPTSLEYLTAGTGFCLMSQLTAANMFLRLDIKDYRVEQQINYRQENFMSADMAGFADSVITKVVLNSPEAKITKVVLNSPEAKETLLNYYKMSLDNCFAGEAFMNETPIESNLYLNGSIIK